MAGSKAGGFKRLTVLSGATRLSRAAHWHGCTFTGRPYWLEVETKGMRDEVVAERNTLFQRNVQDRESHSDHQRAREYQREVALPLSSGLA